MPRKTSFEILYAFHAGHEYVVEVKRLDLPAGADKSLVYHWLHVDGAQGNVQALGFRSMGASTNVQSRVFDESSLRFNEISAVYSDVVGEESPMANVGAAGLSQNIMVLISKFLA